MPDKTKKPERDENFFPESNSTEYDADPLVTDSEASNTLRQELRAAINTMGPETPSYFKNKHLLKDVESSSSKLLEVINQTFPVESKQGQPEIKELFKKDLPLTDGTDSDVDVEKTPRSSMIIYNDEPTSPSSLEEMQEARRIYRCRCSRKESFLPLQNLAIGNFKRGSSRLNRSAIVKWFRNRATSPKKRSNESRETCEFYKMCIAQPEDDHSPPRKVIFNLVDELPKPKCATIGVNTRKQECQIVSQAKEYKDWKNNKAKSYQENTESLREYPAGNERNENVRHKVKTCRCGSPARVDVYYFDHGNASYLRTTDNPPLIRSEIVADQSEECNNKFWGEIFGTIHIGTSFITSFILQLFRFLLQSIIRPLTIGILQLASDYFFKPFLATVFNALIQPPLIFFYNICTSLRDICDPLAEGIGYFIREIAILFQSCRLVEIKKSRPCDERCVRSVHVKPENNQEKLVDI